MNKKFAVIIVIVSACIALSGQANRYGIPLFKNYPPGITLGSEQNWCIVQDQRGVVYVGNDDKGILEYDGAEWRTIEISNKSSVRSLAVSDHGTVYVGAILEIGFLQPGQDGDLRYTSLLPLVDTNYHNFTDIWKTYCYDDKVYFCSQRYILVYDESEQEINVIDSPDDMLFSFLIDSVLYTGSYSSGLVKLEGERHIPVKGSEHYLKNNIFGLVRLDEQRLVAATENHGLSILNTETGTIDSTFTSPAAREYLIRHNPSNLIRMINGDFLVSTLSGGLAMIGTDGRLKEILTKDEGMQAQTVFFSYVNPETSPYPQVWSALNTGVTKTGFNSPFRRFTEEMGYLGLILTINSIDGRIFIGTSSGLYYLRDENGKSVFHRIGNINNRVWSLKKFTYENGKKVLLGATDKGFLQVSYDGRAEYLDSRVKNKDIDGDYRGYSLERDPTDPNRFFIGRDADVIYMKYHDGQWHEEYHLVRTGSEVRFFTSDNDGMLWFGTILSGIGKVDPNDTLSTIRFYTTADGLPSQNENFVTTIDGRFLVGTRDGIYVHNKETDRFSKDSILNSYLPEGTNAIGRIYQDRDSALWISFENDTYGWMILYLEPGEDGYSVTRKPFYSLSSFETDAFYSFEDGKVWFSRSNVLYHFEKDYRGTEGNFGVLVRRVKIGTDSILFNGAYPHLRESGNFGIAARQEREYIPEIRHSDNNIEFRWAAPYFDHEEEIQYSFYLDGFSDDWSPWSDVLYKDFTNIPHGHYTFRIKARNIYNEISLEDSYSFEILRPWYLSFFAVLGYIIIAVLIIYIIIVLYTRRLKNENIRLEGIIQERTAEIRKQKEELTDSIEYASRIQRALLPPDQMLHNHGIDHFILFKPRDIVSGDFYWFGIRDNKLFIVAADCTGHGVPGAFMSMLGISFLDEIVIKSGITATNQVLDSLRQHVITSLRQTGKSMEESTKDGMDLAMVAIDKKARSLQFSGAYNPLYGVRRLSEEEKKKLASGEELDLDRGTLHNETHLLFQVKGDQMPIGISEKDHTFKAHEVDFEGLTIYLFSDGYVDQFGGPTGKKFMSKNFKKLLLDIQEHPLEKQRELLDQTLIDWMADISQIDDILVIGIRLSD